MKATEETKATVQTKKTEEMKKETEETVDRRETGDPQRTLGNTRDGEDKHDSQMFCCSSVMSSNCDRQDVTGRDAETTFSVELLMSLIILSCPPLHHQTPPHLPLC